MSLDQKHNPESLDTVPVSRLLPPLLFDPRLFDGDEYLADKFSVSLADAAETALKINTDREHPLPEEVVLAAVRAAYDMRIERSIAAADRFYSATLASETGKRIHGMHEFMNFGAAAKHFIDNPWLDEMDLGAQVYNEATPGLADEITRQLRTYFLTIRDISDEGRRQQVETREVAEHPEYTIVVTNELVAHSKSRGYLMTGERVWVRHALSTDDDTVREASTPIMESISVQRTVLHKRRMKHMPETSVTHLTPYDLEEVLED